MASSACEVLRKRSEDGRFGTVDPSPTMGAQQNAFNRSPFAVPGALLADGAAASLTHRGTHCALAVSATGSARARGRGEIFSQDKQQREP